MLLQPPGIANPVAVRAEFRLEVLDLVVGVVTVLANEGEAPFIEGGRGQGRGGSSLGTPGSPHRSLGLERMSR